MSKGLRTSHDLQAVLTADGRECRARPVRGTGLGRVAGLCVRGTTPQAVRAALDWMPGRVLVLADDGLSTECLMSVARSAHLDTLSGIVVLTAETDGLGPLERVESAIPVVAVDREADQQWVRRAVRLVVEVRTGEQDSIDLRSHHPPRPRRGGSASIILGSPGTVRH